MRLRPSDSNMIRVTSNVAFCCNKKAGPPILADALWADKYCDTFVAPQVMIIVD